MAIKSDTARNRRLGRGFATLATQVVRPLVQMETSQRSLATSDRIGCPREISTEGPLMHDLAPVWPDLPYAAWRETAATLHLWTQVVGKVRLALTPWVNHGWQVPLYVSSRGLTTSPIPVDNEILEIEFDFISHRLLARTSRGEERSLALAPQTVADFYVGTMDVLRDLGVSVAIDEVPNEVPDPIRFSQDRTHAPMTPPPSIASGGFSSRPIAFSRCFAAASSARRARCISSGAASTSRSRASPDGRLRCIPAACPGCPTPSRAKRIRTR